MTAITRNVVERERFVGLAVDLQPRRRGAKGIFMTRSSFLAGIIGALALAGIGTLTPASATETLPAETDRKSVV